MKKILNEIELRLRKDENPAVMVKRARKEGNKGRIRKLVTLVSGKGGEESS